MKKIWLLLNLIITSAVLPQTIDFDNSSNWTAGSGVISGYQIDHQYNSTISGFSVNFTGGPALRQTSTEQDGFPGSYNSSSYAWRLENNNTVSWIATLSATGINGFSFRVRRWDDTPSPDFDVAFSTDGGTNWTSVGTINNTFLSNSSDWSLFSYSSSISAATNIKIRIKANGTTERIMVDDFTFDSPTPVELSSFTSSLKGRAVNLQWITQTEVTNYGFEIERASCSTSPIQGWEKIGFIAGAGNSNSPKYYSFTDNKVPGYGKYSYRLKQLDTDGKFEYSKEVEVDFGSIKDFLLHQNYPNPFNPSTLISYLIPQAVHVKLSVFNVLGSEIAILVDEFQEAGYYSKEFSIAQNGLNLTNGVYFYKLEAGTFAATKKFILMK